MNYSCFSFSFPNFMQALFVFFAAAITCLPGIQHLHGFIFAHPLPFAACITFAANRYWLRLLGLHQP
jgi:hypothetical protein